MTSERVGDLLAAVRDLDEDERREFDEALRPPKEAEPDYETPIVLRTPVDMGQARMLTEIRLTRRPAMRDFTAMTKDAQRGTDQGTILLRVCTQLTGVPLGVIEKLDVVDAGVLLRRLTEWLRPFIDSMG